MAFRSLSPHLPFWGQDLAFSHSAVALPADRLGRNLGVSLSPTSTNWGCCEEWSSSESGAHIGPAPRGLSLQGTSRIPGNGSRGFDPSIRIDFQCLLGSGGCTLAQDSQGMTHGGQAAAKFETRNPTYERESTAPNSDDQNAGPMSIPNNSVAFSVVFSATSSRGIPLISATSSAVRRTSAGLEAFFLYTTGLSVSMRILSRGA